MKYSFSFLGYRQIVLKKFQISFSLIKEGHTVFSPLRKRFIYKGKTNTITLPNTEIIYTKIVARQDELRTAIDEIVADIYGTN
ncbi:MAG: hypothetical protein WC897_05600 [Candidatus Gracilibacteria bacterium]